MSTYLFYGDCNIGPDNRKTPFDGQLIPVSNWSHCFEEGVLYQSITDKNGHGGAHTCMTLSTDCGALPFKAQ